jgi:hypothetical protein
VEERKWENEVDVLPHFFFDFTENPPFRRAAAAELCLGINSIGHTYIYTGMYVITTSQTSHPAKSAISCGAIAASGKSMNIIKTPFAMQ